MKFDEIEAVMEMHNYVVTDTVCNTMIFRNTKVPAQNFF